MDITLHLSERRERETPPIHWAEILLLVLGGGFMFVNLLALTLERRQFDLRSWLPLIVWISCAVAGSRLLDRWLPLRDRLLFPLALLMSGWGLVVIDRLAPNFTERQSLWLLVSVAALMIVIYTPRIVRLLRAYRYTLLVVGFALLIATILLGTNPSGLAGAPELWLGVGGLFFQPSEALKVILVVFLASYLAEQYPAMRASDIPPQKRATIEHGRFSPRIAGPVVLMWGLSVVILVWQRDLGTAILFFMVFLVLLYVATGYIPLLLIGAVLIAVAGLVAYRLFDVVQLRVDIWLNPWLETDTRAFQIVQSLLAFAAGGVFGQGIGQGSPTYIPVVHSDFVFAALAEEWGLLGIVAVVACFTVFVVRGLRIAILQRTRPFPALMAVGLSVMIAAQSLLIMGGVLKLIPLTGVTLPYFSYGGSSLLVNFVMVGLLLRLSSGENYAMQFTREINRLVFALLVLFGIVVMAAAYWAVIGPDTILRRNDNPRLVEAAAEILRGALVDRDGRTLVESTSDQDGRVTRQYLYPAMYSALGYFSLRYGVDGAESAFDSLLSGSSVVRDTSTVLIDSLLHRATVGSDARLTLDLDVQEAVADAMGGLDEGAVHSGAVVVLSVPDGAVLAMLSLPTYDPNTLDANWNELVAAPGKPFFNRVLQGRYQPGGALETPLMAAAFLVDQPLGETIEQASDPVTLNDVELSCAVRLPSLALSLRDAYAFACPNAFRALALDLGVATVQATVDTFRLDEQPTLTGFVANTTTDTGTPIPTPVILTDDDLTRLALGQGALTVSPLNMAMMAAAIVNDGNAPQPYILIQTRDPNTEEWVSAETVRPTIPLATANTARQLQDWMRAAIANGAAQNAGRPNIDIGGHAALAYSGDSSLAWFVGFATFAGRQGAAVAVVLENSSDPGLAADIGGTALAAAQAALAQP